ncbi:MAG: lipid-A-disaccharide synthase [Magnetococcales bacterium]|nr:lipid-A-disaccharide synthase [Magnetococcales bacterium]
MTAKGRKILLIAGEASGDLLGADLMAAIRERIPEVSFMGIGGPGMRSQGMTGPFDSNHLSVIGVVEVVRRLPDLLRAFDYLLRLMDRERPDLVVTIDLPDFNFLVARRARARDIPVLHYVSPQVWAWRRGRAKRLHRFIDHLLLLFPFEQAIYAETPLPVTFVGHPLVGRALPWSMRPEGAAGRARVRQSLGIGTDESCVVLLPGSRRGEIGRLFGPMIRSCFLLRRTYPDMRFVVACAPTVSEDELERHWPEDIDPTFKREVPIRSGATYDLVASADAALVTSGTATLETALIGTPQVVCYRVSPMTYPIGRLLVRIPFFSLVNLVAGWAVVRERLQHEVVPEILCADLDGVLHDPGIRMKIKEGYGVVREKLTRSATDPFTVVEAMLEKRSGAYRVPENDNHSLAGDA